MFEVCEHKWIQTKDLAVKGGMGQGPLEKWLVFYCQTCLETQVRFVSTAHAERQ